MAENKQKKQHHGLVMIFTGDGKGKTSAAIGTAIRAVGAGMKVCFVSFFKTGSSGECKVLSGLGVEIASFGTGKFIDPVHVKVEDFEQAKKAFAYSRELILGGKCDVLIMDEVNVALAWKLIDVKEMLALIDEKPPQVELILTGRGAPPELQQRADLITEMLKIKHPFDEGIGAREGIDY